MLQSMALFLLSTRFGVAVTQNLNGMAGFFQRHFAGTDNLRIVSIILLLLAFILFLFLIVILYIKSLLSFIKNDVGPVIEGRANTKRIAGDLQNERDTERDLERELAKSQQQKQYEQLQKRNRMEAERRRESMEKEENERRQAAAEKKAANNILYMPDPRLNRRFDTPPVSSRGKASSVEFDWRKGRHGELDEAAAGIEPFKYIPAQRPLSELTGLIINMLGRDIDDGKIAQTIKSKCGDMASEDDVIQLIAAIKNFISLCNNNKFSMLPEAEHLPSADEALYNLVNGDAGSCLEMMEALMDYNIDKCQQLQNSQKRDIAFLETSNYACTFGTLASLQDVQLATGAFELAVELSPKNVNAWSRAGDMYMKTESDSKAIWAYQNVLKIGDEDLYPHQMANANKQLSQYYRSQGDQKQAAKLYNISNDYYTTIGISQNLTGREQEIINIIESKQDDDMPDTINKLLNITSQRRRSYM